jgi:hypothetical protein
MTKKLEELFDLPSSTADTDETVPDIATTQYAITEIDNAIDKIDAALPGVRDLEASDGDMDELAQKATETFDDLMDLGMQVGQWFKTQSIELVVTEGQLCESACAVAFLGASFKRVQATGRVVLHFNGELGRGLDCARSTDMMPFRSYLLSVKGNQSGQILYNQALTYCRNSKGWDLS